MRISSVLKIKGALFLILSLLTVGSVYYLDASVETMELATKRQAEFKQLGIDLATASDYLTNEARYYVQFGDKKHLDNYWKEVNETKTRDRVITRLKELNAPQEELDLLAKAKQNSDVLIDTEDRAMKAVEAKNFEAARHLMFDETYDANKKLITDPINEFQKKMNSRAEQEAQSAKERVGWFLLVTNVMIGLMVIVIMSMLVLLYRKIKPLSDVATKMQELANSEADLTVRLSYTGKDEVGQIVRSFNTMLSGLQGLIRQVVVTTEQAASACGTLATQAQKTEQASQHISGTVQEVAAGSDSQLQGAEETARAMEEIAAGVQRIAESSSLVSEAAIHTTKGARDGNHTIQKVVTQIGSIHNSVSHSASVVQKLGERSAQIGQIVEVITDIANQTNLLALNAAIEAARAGEHGKGFAVVADEVRKLAEQSKVSAEQISNLIQEIKTNTIQAVETMQKGTEDVEEGMIIVQQSGEAFEHILHSIEQVAGQIQEVSAASEEISASTEEVSAAVEDGARVSKEAADHSRQVAALSMEQMEMIQDVSSSLQQLEEIAQNLHGMVYKFKI
ncbi:methyl-accepting chemotaxis protein [Aneurinibacillus soli]|uniref:Methyl-accepting chemotaxis protein McpA n=1 Tax=Aneurinibacillus soli TaxID=1500254 RepID=A0A0U5AYD0_9BACL|nr:HAMP domain-containing methyl-accepting chemotaxis protein [Aneurinibacillus soli]PYE62075.1 methyl-accepting chemotaxis protein [Aneurinibacillus soli]BAU28737.1 Methyl-accepting chemotaxis protein McpA [Aneurinibacillus soli]